MAKKVWKDIYYIDAYELAKNGLSARKIAAVLGVSQITFTKWVEKKRLLKLFLRKGRKIYKANSNSGLDFRDYIFQRLPKNLRKLWRKIQEFDKASSGTERIEALLANRGKNIRQHLFVHAWSVSNFSLSQALRKVCISRSTFDKWKQDPDFLEIIGQMHEHKKEFFSDHLFQLVAGGSEPATIFGCKTFAKDLGFADSKDINLNISGELKHTIVDVSELDLSIKVQRELLQSIKRRNKRMVNQNNQN